ncbi:MAG: translocation/assembly module TamB domain-containing protein [Myxococcales bacterium]|nr:translocation/assembly module TamB domain-containing protein [Myxococcales bacterium]MDH5305755.1 translocation/assembly module TamB domain-containing protein [Myxococcales bacterium]MDH5566525.1 translocation/assembly module TamB domain-containing protein [Myxococcales bacterium]
MRRGLRLAWAVAAGIALLAVCVVVLLAALALGFQRERLRAFVEASLEDALGTEVAIGALEGRLLPGLALRDLAIGPESARWVEVQRAAVRIGGFDFGERRVKIAVLRLAGVRVRIDRRAGGAAWPALPPDDIAEPATPSWSIRRAELRDAEIELIWGDACAGPCRLAARGRASAQDLVWPVSEQALAALVFDAEADFDGVVPGVAAPEPLALHGNATLRLEDRLLDVPSLALRAGDWEIALDAPAQIALRPGGFRIEHLGLASAGASLRIQGGVSPERFEALALELRAVEAARLAALAGVATEVEGRIDADFQLDGALARPEVRGELRWQEARIGRMPRGRIVAAIVAAEPRIEATLRAEAGERELAVAEVRMPYSAALHGDLSPTREMTAILRSDGLDLALLAVALPGELRSLGGTARGELALRGGTPPAVEGWLEIEQGQISLPRLGDALTPFRARASLRPADAGVFVEALRVETPLGRLDAHGIVSEESLRDAHLALEALDVGALAAQLGAVQEVGGVAAAQLDLAGPFAHLTLRGRGSWEAPRVATARAERLALEIDLDAAQLRASAQLVEAGRAALEARAVLPRPSHWDAAQWLGPGARVDIEGADFDLAALSPFFPRQLRDIRGRANLVLRAEGGLPAPRLSGELDIADGALSVPLLGRRYEPIEGRVRLDAQRVLPELRVGPPEARGSLTGSVELEGVRPSVSDLELVLTHFALARSRVLQLDVTGSLRLVGPVRALALLGGLRLEHAQLRVPEPRDPILREIRIASQAGADVSLVERPPAPPSALERARMDLALSLPRNSWIRGRGLELELEGDLDVQKSALGPVRYAGTLDAVRGRFSFLGKRFEMRSGTTTFDGSERLDPLIDVEALHRVRDVDIVAVLTGRLSNPTLRLSSEPAYEETDVLSLLLVGRRADELDEKAGGFDAAATKLAAGVAASELTALLRDYVPIDTLEVRVGEGGVPEQIGVGKYVWQDLFVRYDRSFGTDPKDEVGIQYRIDEHWSVESEMATDRSAGADLVWGIDF